MVNRSKLALLGGLKIRDKPFPAHPVLGQEERREVNDVLDSGMLSGFIANAGKNFLGGPKVHRLEEDFKKYFKVKYAIAVNSATAGLHAALAAVDIGPGDEVIVSPYTMSASASAILMAQGIPVFADIDANTFCIDPREIEKRITPRTRAVVVVHLFGQAADMKPIMSLARKHKLALIEDTAQAPAAVYQGKYAGTIGDAGVFSLNQHKTITTGEGGIVVTDNRTIAQKVQLIRNHGEVVVERMGFNDIVNILGWNYRMTELEAAVGVAQFRKLDTLTSHRIQLAQYLTAELKKLKFPGLITPSVRKNCNHVYFTFPLALDQALAGISRRTLVAAVQAEGIPIGAGYVRPIYWEPMYQKQICYGRRGYPFKSPLYKGKVDYRRGLCPVAERMHSRELLLTGVCRYPLLRKDIRDVVLSFEKIREGLAGLKAYDQRSRKGSA